ncbi:Glycosyltransferase involved in cell wall bisynthesis [Duganella sp. CF517]|uniref:glycosyltransferase family 2 protein n=1 Tax=Duganella sp. CF517 TaxID=1881038 RepID=UPI0008B1F315|nr:glycosyltransferase family 2 protein [Duganella sp. CF517]SEO20867.1 Glycosyltransferase involved in cell wall bisynthesis [Duganella sp. CF517]
MPQSPPRILVFIPAYRCAPQIVRVIDQFDERVQRAVDTVMVVDNRSPDNTLQAAVERAATRLTHCNFIAWTNDDNYGLGGSHKAALRYAIEHGFDYLVVLHGDDQADIRDLLPELERGAHLDADCLLGARFMPGSRLLGYSALRTFGNRVYNLLFSLGAGRRIYDLGSGLNLYRLAPLREFYYKGFPDDLTFNYVMLLGSYHAGQRVRFFPISWREDDQVSNVRLFRQAFKVLGLLGAYCLRRGRFLAGDMRAKAHAAYSGSIVARRDVVRQDE